MLHDLILNTALLVVLSAFYEILVRYKPSFPHITTLFMGVFFGAVAITAMLIPFFYTEGILIDGRSIVLALGGLFGGPVVAAISGVMAVLFRIFTGGQGTLAGVLIILFSASFGVWIRHYYMESSSVPTLKHLFFTTIGAHFLMLMSLLFLPWPEALDAIIATAPIVITLFPAITLLIGFLMISAEKRLQAENELKENEALYRTTLYSIGDAVILTDRKGKIKKMNDMASKLTGWTEEEAQKKPVEKVFDIINEYSRQKVENPISKVLAEGTVVELANHTMLRTRKGQEVPIADSGAPIIDDKGRIAGVVMVFQDQTEERQRQNELKKSHEQYRNLIETTSAIAWEYDIQKDRWTYVAPQVTKILQYDPEEWTDLAFWKKQIHPADRDLAVDYCLTSTQKQMNHTLEYRFRKKGGDYVWLRDVVTVESENGRPARLRGLMFDISSRKNAELALQESEKQFRKLFEEHTAVKLLIDPDTGEIVQANHAASNFYGWPMKTLVNMNIIDINTLSQDEIKKEMDNARWQRRNHFEFKHRKADGSVCDVEVFASHVELKGKDYLHSIIHDVSEKKRLERERNLLSESVKQNPAAVIITNEKKEIEYVNPVFSKITGYNSNEVMGSTPVVFNEASKQSQPGRYAEIMETVHKGETWQGEYSAKTKDGYAYWERALISPILDPHSNIQNFVLIMEDVTSTKQMMTDLEEAKNKAEESQRLKTAFLANMSHEIRTPLNGILGFTELLTSDVDLPREQKIEFGKTIQQSAEGLLQIINDVLDISRLESEKISVDRAPFKVGELLQSLFNLYEKKLTDMGKTGVELCLDAPDKEIEITADEGRLRQILINLLDNALKFTQKGKIEFGISKVENGQVRFKVTDTGIGIRKEKHNAIFDRFSQADEDISSRYGGTGLGLAIVKKLTEMMGSGIFLDSEPGEGSTFWFELPGSVISN